MSFPRTLFTCGVLLFLRAVAGANDPGGGTNGVGPNVTLTDKGSSVVLANGTLTATVTKSTAHVTSLLYLGRQMVSSGGDMYFSMDGGTSYEQPGNCVYTVKTSTGDMVDIGLKCLYTTNRIHAFDIDIHYVLRRGDSGLYVYALLSHPASYPATSYGEWRMVWKMDQDPLERIYVDDLRNWQQPSAYDLAHALPTGIAEIVQLTTGPWAGRYDCKYMYNVEYQYVGCYGHASNTNRVGAWAVFGGYDYFNDGPTKQDLAPASGIIHVHFGRNHYNGSGLSVTNGETWSKFYGPWLLYCNTNAAGGDACWADAKAQADAEKGAWPYDWLTGVAEYPPAAARGTVSGTLVVSDALKAGVRGAGAWVGLADPSADWQFDSKFYQYWVQADGGGNFIIPDVRPGSYTLHAFTVGAVGEYAQANVTVAAGATNGLGALTWNVPHAGGYLAWEIGVPDRTATDFRHGTNYWEPYIWDSFAGEFSNPLEYDLDSGNPAWDLNYAHNFYGTNTAVWSWDLNFVLPSAPPNSNARLTIATAGGQQAHLYVYVNGNKRGDFYPANAGGNTLLRQGVHDKYGANYVTFNAATFLHAGTNTIRLQQVNSTPATGNHTMYDYLALEMPGTAPAVQFLTWTGGAAGNAWDLGVTTNWCAYGRKTAYSNGAKVLFNDTGTNSPAIQLVGLLAPGTVVFNSTRDFVLAGAGSLGGTMSLVKKGPGRLTVMTSNSYTGSTMVGAGTLALGGAASIAASQVVTVQAGGTLDGSGLASGALAFNSGQTLSGNGSVVGNVTLGAGAILSPGPPVGVLRFSNSLTLMPGSATVLEISKSPLTNDQLQVSGALALAGSLVITNLGGTLAAGDSFKILSGASVAGVFTTASLPLLNDGLAWSTDRLAIDGTLWVVYTNAPLLSGWPAVFNNIVLVAAGGTPGWPCYLLTATNVALPLTQWSRAASNAFDLGGQCRFTNAISSGSPQQFYRLQTP